MGRVATIRQRNADYQVTWRSVEQLIPYARNARTHSDEQVAQIAASVREFGWTNPVLVDEADGHRRHGRAAGWPTLVAIHAAPVSAKHGGSGAGRGP